MRERRGVREVAVLEDRVGTALSISEMTGAPPPRVDRRYRLTRMLGRGANGVVVEAKDERLDRDVALKLFANWDDRVLREARAIAKLDHRNIIRVHDVGVGELASEGESPLPCAYLSMALVRGKSMRDWLASDKPSEPRIRSVLASAGDGLAAAHEAGLVHRDIKPENIMVGSDDEALVVDFGLARPPPARGDVATLAGTPPYMAPEALGGEVSAEADVYAFARVTVEMLTGVLPSNKRGLDAILANLPRPTRNALRRALDPVPKRRPKVAAIVKALRRRRRRLVWSLAFLLAVVGLFVAFRSNTFPSWAEGLVPHRSTVATSPHAICNDISGVWMFETTVITGDGAGAQGRYVLSVLANCEIERIRKIEWSNGGDSVWRPVEEEHSDVSTPDQVTPNSLEFECELSAHYRFALHFDEDQIRGSYRQLGHARRTVRSGSVTGHRHFEQPHE